MYLGIDLGTSNSAIVGIADGALRLFKTSDGRDVLPSVIYVDKRGAKFVGPRAYEQLQSAPENVAQGFKRLMGTNSRLELKLAGISISSEEASADVLRTLISQCRSAVGDALIEGAVVTIPAAFNQMQSEATIRAAHAAGLDRVGLIQEPVAAAMSALEGATRRDGRFLVYDLGGGTFDVALVESLGGTVTVLAHDGVNMMGGRDHDRVILDSIVRPWLTQHYKLPDNPHAVPKYKRLFDIARAEAEVVKIELSERKDATIYVSEEVLRVEDEDGTPIYLEVPVQRAQLEALIADRVDESIAICRNLLSKNGLTHEDIDRIVFIGGPSKMPCIRERVPTALGIPADLSADPMTAVARGAAIFAESRDWSGVATSRKPARASIQTAGPLDIRFDFTVRATAEVGRIRIKVGNDARGAGASVQITGPQGFDTGRIGLTTDHDETVQLPTIGPNHFTAKVFSADGAEVLSEEIIVTRVHASASAATAASTVSVKIQAGPLTAPYNTLDPIIEKGTSLPKSGTAKFLAKRELLAGTPGYIDLELFNQAEGIDDPSLNLFIGVFRVSAEGDLEPGQKLRLGTELLLHWRMDDNGLIKCEIEVPDLGLTIDQKNFYVPEAGHKSFDGAEGQRLAENAITEAESSIQKTEGVIGSTAKAPIAQLQRRLGRQRELLTNSADAEARRAVTEEARHVQQELARLRSAPEHRRTVLLAELEDAEDAFANVVEDASPTSVERMGTLGRSGREALAREDWDRARQIVEEMRGLMHRALQEQPGFWLVCFDHFSEQRFGALDKKLHDQLVKAGKSATEENDIEILKNIVLQMSNNRIPSLNDSRDVAILSGLSKA